MQPPNEPPHQPPYQSPIPSPYTPPSSGAVPPQGPPQVNFDVISHAWEMLKPNLGIWVGAYLIYLIISTVASLVIGQLTGNGIPLPGQQNVSATPNIALMFLGQFANFVISFFLMSGLYRLAINNVRTGVANLGDMFSVTDVLPALIIASILYPLAIFGGALFCIIPGILLAGLFMFTFPLIVDQKMSALDAMKTSLEALKPQMWMAVAFTFVIGILTFIGMALCCVGVLITGPLGILATAILYRDFFPNKTLA